MRRKTIYDGDEPHPHPYVVDDPREAALPDSQFTLVDNVLIHFVHHSHSPDAPTAVLMHGFSGECPRSEKRGKMALTRLRQPDQLLHHAAVGAAGPALQPTGL